MSANPTPAPRTPLVEQIPSDTTHIAVIPAFGSRLHLVIHTNGTMPDPMEGAVAGVSIWGSGAIEYHTDGQPPAPQRDAHAVILDALREYAEQANSNIGEHATRDYLADHLILALADAGHLPQAGAR